MKQIGGFLDLESFQDGDLYHNTALALNTGRNSFELFLASNPWIKKVRLPFYHCEVLTEPIKKLGIDFSFYLLTPHFLPELLQLEKNEIILYINFFGIFDSQVIKLAKKYSNQLIVDNTQAFFSDPLEEVSGTFYSARKYFGVPDGAYLYGKAPIKEELEQDISYHRCAHLLKRWDLGPEVAFKDFQDNDKALSGQPVKKMSRLTKALLQNINYKKVYQTRNKNFRHLHDFFSERNELSLDPKSFGGPLCYPFLTVNGENLKKGFIKKKVFIPTYWPNLESLVPDDSFERRLIKDLVCLPIDQRYSTKDMDYIISIYLEFEKQ